MTTSDELRQKKNISGSSKMSLRAMDRIKIKKFGVVHK
jgi:hypothetical protein